MASLLDHYSLEMTAKDGQALEAASECITAGTEISITFLPGEDRDARIAAAQTVKRTGMIPLPHISARRVPTSEELDVFVEKLVRQAGVDRVFVVAGDSGKPEGPYEDSLAVIRSGRLARHGIRKVGIAGYPEGHPDIPQARLWAALKEKQSTLAALGHSCEIVSQFSFDAQVILQWLERVRDEGIIAPVKVGIPGPASVKSLLRFAARCGVSVSTKVMGKYGLSLAKLLSSAGPDALIEELEANLNPSLHGAVKLHLYTFSGLARTAQWAYEYRASHRSRPVSASVESFDSSGG